MLFALRTSSARAVGAGLMLSALSIAAIAQKAAPSAVVADLGPELATTSVQGTVWLQLHNKAALDAQVKAMYTPGSPSYHQFSTPKDLAQFAPTAAEIEAVKKELAANRLTVTHVDPFNLSVNFTGTAANFEAAFHTNLNRLQLGSGATIRSFTGKPALRNGAANLTLAVTGVRGTQLSSALVAPRDPDTGLQLGVRAAGASSPDGAVDSSQCIYGEAVQEYTTPGAAYPLGIYQGIVYGAPITNTAPGTKAPCGYSPADLTKLLGLSTAYNKGYQGQGQTIAIVDAYGSPTIAKDLASYNSTYSLPSSPFSVVEPTPFTATNSGWATETTLDVELSHAIAPKASIVLVAAPTNYDNDLQNAVLYIIENKLANVISNSYSGSEYGDINYGGTQDLTAWDEICELASFEGISANFATGDDGDDYNAEGVIDVGVPADSGYATAVGGTSSVFSPVDGSTLTTGWGNNITRLATSTAVLTTPLVEGFDFGAGGGVSQAFTLPTYQAALNGTGRMLPDVSALADPYTGAEILITGASGLVTEVYGGTSLATPIFSAEWTLLNQAAGYSLGQAAPLVAEAAGTALINDVLPPSGIPAVQGAVFTTAGVTNYSASQLIAPETSEPFFSALYNSPSSGSHYALSFGTDSSLAITPGYDNVTGWGTLNLPAIFSAF